MQHALLVLAILLAPCIALAQGQPPAPMHPAEERLHGFTEGHVRVLAPHDLEHPGAHGVRTADPSHHSNQSHITHKYHEGRIQIRYDAATRSGHFAAPAGTCAFQLGLPEHSPDQTKLIHGTLNVTCPDSMGPGGGGWTLSPDHKIHAHIKTSKGYEINITLN